MSGIRIGAMRADPRRSSRVHHEVEIGGERRRLSFEVTGSGVSSTSDAALAAALLPAMKIGEPLVVEGPVSPLLLENAGRIQNVHRIWRRDEWCPEHPTFATVPVVARSPRAGSEPGGADPERGSRVGAFFSAGVDSFHTALDHADEISDLIFLHDFESPDAGADAELVYGNVRDAARALEKDLVEVRTNAREVFGRYVSWHHYHGSVLAAAGLLMALEFRRVYVPSSHDVAQLFPWGSHPETDPLYGVEGFELVHDRYDRTRLDKIARIVGSEVAMEHLQVCWKPRRNCGTCNKCVRTLLALQVLGMEDRAFTFARPALRPDEVERIDLREWQTVKYFAEMRDHLVDSGERPDLRAAIERAIALEHYRGIRYRVRVAWERLRRGVARIRRFAGRRR